MVGVLGRSVEDAVEPAITRTANRSDQVIKAGERGYYVTDFDGQAMELAEARILVDRLNVRRGVTDAQHQAMVAGSAFGFHVPAADPDHPSNGCTLRTVDASMAHADIAAYGGLDSLPPRRRATKRVLASGQVSIS